MRKEKKLLSDSFFSFYRLRLRQIYQFCLVFCCFFTLNTTCLLAEEIALDASWQISSSHPGDAEDINGFNQRYGLGWSPRVTRAILFDANMNYSKNVTTGNVIRESISPTGSLQVDNDLFFAELSGLMNQTNNSQSYDQTDSSWEAILASNWEYNLWPSMSFSVGQNWLIDGEQIHITDSSRQWSELIAEWETDTFEAYYSYYTQLRDDSVELTSYDEKKHFGRIDYGDSYFANKVSFSFSGQLTESATDFSAAGDGNEIAIKVGLSQGLAGVDPSPESGFLPKVPALIDGNRNNVVFAINLHEVANLGVKADMQQVDSLYVYTGQLDPLLVAETASLRWDLYSSEDGVNWRLEVRNAATSYDENKFRYEVRTGGLKRIYLKLVVNSWPTTLAVPVTEIAAFRDESETGSDFSERQDYTRVLTDANIRYTPSANSSLSYSVVWDDSVSNVSNDRQRIFQTGSLRWEYNQYFIPAFTVNDTATVNSTIADTAQRSYALTIQSFFLPTLETNIGVTRNENSNDDESQTTNDNVYLQLTAALYPNLDTTLDINTNFNSNEDAGGSNQNLGLRWTLTARLRPTLLVDLIAEHGSSSENLTEVIDSPESGGQVTINANWRPSELLSILVNGSKGYGEQWSGYQRYLVDTNLSLIRTSKVQFTVGYKLNSTENEAIHNFNTNWSWNISEFFTMQSIANYIVEQDNNSWFINTRITARF